MSKVRADRYSNRAGTGAPTFTEGANISNVLSVDGNLGIGTTIPVQRFQVGTGPSVIVIDSTGELGIGTTNPTVKLDIIGDVNVSGVLTATDVDLKSDISLKENITTIENALTRIENIRGVRFNWKENHKPSYGVIAQELEEVFPELVGPTDPKTVNYNGIIGVLIEAVKELRKEIEELKSNK